MRNKKITAVLTIIAVLSIIVCGCGKDEAKSDTDSKLQSQEITEFESETTTESGTEETGTESVEDENITNYTISNNGGTVVKYGDDIYYWKYNSDSYEKQAVFAEYSLLATGQNQLICQKADGSEEVMVTEAGAGNLYIVRDKLYYECVTSDGGREVCAISRKDDKWDTTAVEIVLKGNILGADEEKGIVIVSKKDNGKSTLSVLDVASNQYTDIAENVTYIMYEDGKIYYQGEITNYENATLGELSIYVSDLNGVSTLLIKTTPDMYELGDGGAVEVQFMQIHNGYAYYSYGNYAGTANYYQGGNICRIELDGKNNEIFARNAEQEFYVYDEEGITKLIYADNLEPESVKVIDVQSKNKADSDKLLGTLNEPFYTSDQKYWIYRDTTGECTPLITNADYGQDTSLKVNIKDVEVVEDELYYTVVYSKYNEEVSIGWRDGYDWVKTEVYKKNLGSGEKEKVYEYTVTVQP